MRLFVMMKYYTDVCIGWVGYVQDACLISNSTRVSELGLTTFGRYFNFYSAWVRKAESYISLPLNLMSANSQLRSLIKITHPTVRT